MQRHTKVLAGLLALSLLGAACGDDDDDDAATEDESGGAEVPDGPAISIGAQDFGESLILSEIYAGALTDAGYDADTTEVGGFRDLLFGAFESGDVNMAIDYVASELEFLNDGAGQATSDVNETLAALEPLLEPMGIVAGAPSEAVDTNAFVITQETSDSLGITTLSDLAEKGADLTLGAPPDCESNGFCIPGPAAGVRRRLHRQLHAARLRRHPRLAGRGRHRHRRASDRPTAGWPTRARAGCCSRTTRGCSPPTTSSPSSARRSSTPTATT